ncbi:hypothetical protein ACFUJT_10995 [Streptomyces griseoincarnatus]
MLRITDARTGELVDAAPARRGLTRVEAHPQGLDPTGLRVLLAADLLLRALELGGTPVWALLVAEGRHAELRAAADALGIRPFEDGDGAAGLGEAQVLHVVDEGRTEPDGVRVAVAPVTWSAPGTPEEADQAALRLALLTHPRNAPAVIDADALDRAADTLRRWRGAVADWARRPSRPVPDEVRAELRAAWEEDLDTAAVLGALRAVEADPGLPDGARFETYAYADRLLGLDLARDLGHPA